MRQCCIPSRETGRTIRTRCPHFFAHCGRRSWPCPIPRQRQRSVKSVAEQSRHDPRSRRPRRRRLRHPSRRSGWSRCRRGPIELGNAHRQPDLTGRAVLARGSAQRRKPPRRGRRGSELAAETDCATGTHLRRETARRTGPTGRCPLDILAGDPALGRSLIAALTARRLRDVEPAGRGRLNRSAIGIDHRRPRALGAGNRTAHGRRGADLALGHDARRTAQRLAPAEGSSDERRGADVGRKTHRADPQDSSIPAGRMVRHTRAHLYDAHTAKTRRPRPPDRATCEATTRNSPRQRFMTGIHRRIPPAIRPRLRADAFRHRSGSLVARTAIRIPSDASAALRCTTARCPSLAGALLARPRLEGSGYVRPARPTSTTSPWSTLIGRPSHGRWELTGTATVERGPARGFFGERTCSELSG